MTKGHKLGEKLKSDCLPIYKRSKEDKNAP